jgi:molybdopterin synthase catalytic subunit
MTGCDVADRGPEVVVSAQPIVPGDLLSRVANPAAGAAVLFLGTVRDHSPGRDGVSLLEYEVYDRVVEDKIGEIVAEAREKWPLTGVAVAHRLGALEVGEVVVGVAVSCAHRVDAFEAGRYLIDELKRRAPIWKKEHWRGEAEWVGEGDHPAV